MKLGPLEEIRKTMIFDRVLIDFSQSSKERLRDLNGACSKILGYRLEEKGGEASEKKRRESGDGKTFTTAEEGSREEVTAEDEKGEG